MRPSPWAYTQAIDEVGCPRCNAQRGQPCRIPSGALARVPHVQRVRRYCEVIGDHEFNRRHQQFKRQRMIIQCPCGRRSRVPAFEQLRHGIILQCGRCQHEFSAAELMKAEAHDDPGLPHVHGKHAITGQRFDFSK